jgi:hypothetical protein
MTNAYPRPNDVIIYENQHYVIKSVIIEDSITTSMGTITLYDILPLTHATTIKLYRGGAFGKQAHSEGAISAALQDGAHAEGSYTVAAGRASHAEGDATLAAGVSSHSEGSTSQALEYCAHAEGENTIAAQRWTHVEGLGTVANNQA